MKTMKIGAALALAASLCAPLAATPALADDRQAPSMNARGMSPNTTEAVAFTVKWDNAKRAFNFFVDKGLTKRQAAGVVGNLIVESGMDPTIKQYGGGVGRGIAQWSAGGRWDTYQGDNNVWYANKIGQGRWQLNTQLRFTWYELNNFDYYGLKELKATKYIPGATRVFMNKFEGCGTCHADRRVEYAKKVFNRFA